MRLFSEISPITTLFNCVEKRYKNNLLIAYFTTANGTYIGSLTLLKRLISIVSNSIHDSIIKIRLIFKIIIILVAMAPPVIRTEH